MNWTTIAIGLVAVGLGIFSTYLRFKAPDKLQKLAAMKRQFGEDTGGMIHALAYSVLPIIAGVAFIVLGFRQPSGAPLVIQCRKLHQVEGRWWRLEWRQLR